MIFPKRQEISVEIELICASLSRNIETKHVPSAFRIAGNTESFIRARKTIPYKQYATLKRSVGCFLLEYDFKRNISFCKPFSSLFMPYKYATANSQVAAAI